MGLGLLGQGNGSGGAGLRLLTAKLLLEEVKELRPAQGVGEELAEVEAPALHTQLRGGLHPEGNTSVGAGMAPSPPCTPCIGVEGRTGAGSPPEGTYVGAFMAQYVVSSVIQGLLGRQPDMMGSWGMYCSLNLMYLPGAAAGGGQDHHPTAATGPSHRGAVLGL